MNNREALQALLDDKRIRATDWEADAYVVLLGTSLVNQNGHDVPIGLFSGRKWEVYHLPNLHPVGTFAWAREEVKRGNRIKRPRWPGSWDSSALGAGPLTIEDIDAQDWESLPPENLQASPAEMKLYLVRREDSGCPLDKTHAVMVLATSEDQARLLASQEAGDEGWGVWLSHEVACTEIPSQGPSGVLLAHKM
jgi:hypothetical protein